MFKHGHTCIVVLRMDLTPLIGCAVTTDRDPAEFARLSQLGDILGLGPMDINVVHNEFAERAFNENVKQVCLFDTGPGLKCAVGCMLALEKIATLTGNASV